MKIFLSCFVALFFLSGTPAPDIAFQTSEGEQAQLSDYEGAVVYLSIWASWCGPCLSNFKKYEEIRNQLAAEGVVLINVSIDKDPVAWTAALSKYPHINGINVLAEDIIQLKRDYEIASIPEYHIVNRLGDFVYLPSGPQRDVVGAFRGWLKE